MQIQLAALDAVSLSQLRSTLRRVATLHELAAREPVGMDGREATRREPQSPALDEQPLAA